MEPNSNLKEQLEFANKIVNANYDEDHYLGLWAIELAERVIALNEHICNGGDLPKEWEEA